MEEERSITVTEGEMSTCPEVVGIRLVREMQRLPRAKKYVIYIPERGGENIVTTGAKPLVSNDGVVDI